MDDGIDISRLLDCDKEYIQCLRWRMQTDLFWLSKYVLGYQKLSESHHREVADVFVHKDPRKPFEQQSPKKRRRIILLSRKVYKALALETRIPTPDGFTTMGDIQVGDVVFSDEGKPCKVVGCSPVYKSRQCYAVDFGTGETVIADAGHLWVTDTRRDRYFPKLRSSVKSTEEIANTLLYGNARPEFNHRIKLAAPLDLPHNADLPIDPYVLGCWLGDGNSEGASITIAEPELGEEILKAGEIVRPKPYPRDPYNWVFNGGPDHDDYRTREFSFASRIRMLRLYKNKHIPVSYLRASEAQRWALLQGLMDTDGCVAKRDGRLTFSNTNLRLAEDVKQLVASLGMKPYLNGPYQAKIDGQIVGCFYHVGFKAYSDVQIFRLQRKQGLLRERTPLSHLIFRSIAKVEGIDSVPVRCIMVDSPTQQFLVTDSFIATHNTTMNIADSVQWVLGFPEIAIMAMTASNSPDSPLADAFVAECASHFVCPDHPCRHPLHLCFPEHVIGRLPKSGEFTTPGRKHFRRDPTIKGVSIEQSLSGWHPDIIKSEDVQDNRNSQTVFGLRKVRQNFYINLKMLGETGLVDITGTRYGPMDLYGDMIQKAGPETILLWKPAYVRKPHALKYEDEDLVEDDIVLQFPEQLSWEFLRSEKALDEASFWTQYMNIAEGSFKATFPMEKLESAKVAPEISEREGTTHIAWRFEYGDQKHAACAVGIEKDNRITIVEVVRGQFAPTALAKRVVNIAKKWEAHRVEIEDTPGARELLPHMRNEALEADWRVEIGWSEFLQDETARALSIKCAEPHLLAGRLLFADNLANSQEIFRQLYHFGMIEESEIASVVARVAGKLPASIAAKDFELNDPEAFQKYIEEDAYNRVYGRGNYEEPPPDLPEEEVEWAAQQNDDLSEMMPGLSG